MNKKLFWTLGLALITSLSMQAQDDDLYFAPSKQKSQNMNATVTSVRSNQQSASTQSSRPALAVYNNNSRDEDEYNRRNVNYAGAWQTGGGAEDSLVAQVDTVYVTSPDIVAVRLNGSGDFVSEKKVDTDNMAITLRGSGDISFDDLLCDRCKVDLIGSGDITLDRLEAQSASATLIGSGDIRLKLIKVLDTTLSVKGSGDIKAEFGKGCGAVDCDLNGSGDISLQGKVARFHQSKHGSGDIDIDNLQIE